MNRNSQVFIALIILALLCVFGVFHDQIRRTKRRAADKLGYSEDGHWRSKINQEQLDALHRKLDNIEDSLSRGFLDVTEELKELQHVIRLMEERKGVR